MNEVLGITAAALSLGTPLVIAAAGEVVLERSGVLNIGLEGTMLSSAFAAFSVSHATGSPWLGVLAAIFVALCVSGLTGLFALGLGADQVVVGTGMNLLCLGATGSLFFTGFARGGELLSVPVVPSTAGRIPVNGLMLFAPLLVLAAWWLLWRTRWGLAVRAAGEDPVSCAAAGHFPLRLRWQALGFAAVCAGMAGAYLSVAQTGSFAENMTAGRGFVVIAAVTFGRWTPLGSAGACLLISAAYGVQYLAKARELPIPPQLFDALPYMLALAVLIGAGRGKAGPAALAQPFEAGR